MLVVDRLARKRLWVAPRVNHVFGLELNPRFDAFHLPFSSHQQQIALNLTVIVHTIIVRHRGGYSKRRTILKRQ